MMRAPVDIVSLRRYSVGVCIPASDRVPRLKKRWEHSRRMPLSLN